MMMPFYRVNGMSVHIKFSGKARKNPPLPCCAWIEIDGKAVRCMGISSILCDWKNEDGGTCDAPLCPEHAHEIGKDRHLCAIHSARQRKIAPELF